MRPSLTYVKWSAIGLLLVLLLVILFVNFTSTHNLPDVVRVQVERYAVCSYWFFGWNLASTGAFALFFFLLGLVVGGAGVFFLRRSRPRG
ncbi:MAG: LPXTG cell wall anchor domain-containing protein [Thermaceae bacterium]